MVAFVCVGRGGGDDGDKEEGSFYLIIRVFLHIPTEAKYGVALKPDTVRYSYFGSVVGSKLPVLEAPD